MSPELSTDNLRTITPLNAQKVYGHQEALELIPLLMIVTSKAKKELSLLNSQLAFFKNNSDKANEIQNRIGTVLQVWSEKVRRLGCYPVSMAKVRIPAEEGQFLWEYPENKLFMH
ncbi:MAG: hypothetical protein ACOVP4_09745 [Bacteriovoracaceae bacterium]|jgi:hypothetical protein